MRDRMLQLMVEAGHRSQAKWAKSLGTGADTMNLALKYGPTDNLLAVIAHQRGVDGETMRAWLWRAVALPNRGSPPGSNGSGEPRAPKSSAAPGGQDTGT